MVKAILMEDWLRGCVYHDGRHGEVTLPADKVIEIANYIQLTRTSQTDGCIELPPYTADTPQTERSACDTCQVYNSGIPCRVEPSVCKREVADTPTYITEDRDTRILDAWQVRRMQMERSE